MPAEINIPAHVQYFMANYNEGYVYGMRDGRNQSSFAITNFSQEKHGFMTGYLHGFMHLKEKLKGVKAANDAMMDFNKGIEDGTIYPENDRSGSDEQENAEYIERCKERIKRRELKKARGG